MIRFELKQRDSAPWNSIESCNDATCFHTFEWMQYLQKSKVGKPIIVQISDEDEVIGWFIGVRKWIGLWYVASPLEGTGTYTQGLVFVHNVPDKDRVVVYIELSKWLFRNRLCSFFKADDWQLRIVYNEWRPCDSLCVESIQNSGLDYSLRPTLYLSLEPSEADLWNGLHYKSAKYSINKANKLGLRFSFIRNREDIGPFVKIHYNQLVDVCDRHGMRPKSSQSEKRMTALCESLFPDKVMMFKVDGPDDSGNIVTMSTGIMCPGHAETIYFTGASYRQYQKFCPNELMVWEAIREMKRRGAGDLNFGGIAPYKLKFGTRYAYVPSVVFTKYKVVESLRNMAFKLYHGRRFLMAKLRGK